MAGLDDLSTLWGKFRIAWLPAGFFAIVAAV
jgi:hypothetical protein